MHDDSRTRRQPSRSFCRGLVVGATLGLVLGGAASALSLMGKQAWEGLSPAMRAGYMAGFTDCLRLAKVNDPDGWLARTYLVPPVTPIQWSAKVNELYEMKVYQDSPLYQMVMVAGRKLASETGYTETRGLDPRLEALWGVLQSHQAQEAEKADRAESADATATETDSAAIDQSGSEEADKSAPDAAKPDVASHTQAPTTPDGAGAKAQE